MSDHGKAILHEEKRKERSKQVTIKYVDSLNHHFNVLDEDGNTKYYGVIIAAEPEQKDSCSCDSFYFGNGDEYKKSNPAAFQCKHLIAAREQRGPDVVAEEGCKICGKPSNGEIYCSEKCYDYSEGRSSTY